MSTELFYLTMSAALAMILWVPYVLARVQAWGLVNTLGYPADQPELPAWARRAERAHYNLLENLAPFAVLVIVAQVSNVQTDHTALGAMLFFWARVAHAAVYILGIPFLRTLSFVVAWVGMVLLLVALLS